MAALSVALILALCLAAPALAQDEPAGDDGPSAPSDEAGEDVQEDGFGVGALPAINYNSDEGFGYGVIGTMYWYKGGVEPYRSALTVRFFLTTKNVHAHMLRLDSLDVKDLPLRITAQAGYNSYLTSNYCGLASVADCDPQRAEADADALGFAAGSDAREEFIRRYYYVRYTEPYFLVNGRWKLKDKPHRVEVFGGYRGSLYLAGTPGEATPWPDSYYQAYDQPEGEAGFASVLQAGLMGDNRDNEPAPNRGYWVEASLRGATPFWGSTWTYGGANVTLRHYQTLIKAKARDGDSKDVKRPNVLVAATRLVGDGIVGDAPTNELVRFGGATNYEGIGGQYGGRGMRTWRYIGKAKGLFQEELRFTPLTITPGSSQFDFGLVGFFDYGYAADDFSDLSAGGGDLGVGGGLRISWNRNFIVRVDSGFSPSEDYSQKLYINLDHIF